jgi:siroheme synthase (precorrin-2 oxidase/ferrochelatase)
MKKPKIKSIMTDRDWKKYYMDLASYYEDLYNKKLTRNKIYIVTTGSYAAYRIEAVFLTKSKAYKFAKEFNSRSTDSYYVSKCTVETHEENYLNISTFFYRVFSKKNSIEIESVVFLGCKSQFEMNKVFFNPYACQFFVDVSVDNKKKAAQIAVDLFKEHKALN